MSAEASESKQGTSDHRLEVPSAESPPLESGLAKIAKKPEFFEEIMAIAGSGPVSHPIHGKMTTEHITQVRDLATKHDEREFQLARESSQNDFKHTSSNRRYAFAAFLIVAIITIIIVFTFKDNERVLLPTLSGVGGFLTGAAAGFGIGRSKAN